MTWLSAPAWRFFRGFQSHTSCAASFLFSLTRCCNSTLISCSLFHEATAISWALMSPSSLHRRACGTLKAFCHFKPACYLRSRVLLLNYFRILWKSKIWVFIVPHILAGYYHSYCHYAGHLKNLRLLPYGTLRVRISYNKDHVIQVNHQIDLFLKEIFLGFCVVLIYELTFISWLVQESTCSREFSVKTLF